jgi:hypothetical protein
MYQIHLRAQANKLAALPARWQTARVQSHAAAPRRRVALLHAALATLATLRVMPGGSADSAELPDPRDPRNW